MREFYIYGFKSRDDYSKKSSRSYDDERRRIESWLGDHISFVRTPEGKNVFISIDSRSIRHNPFYMMNKIEGLLELCKEQPFEAKKIQNFIKEREKTWKKRLKNFINTIPSKTKEKSTENGCFLCFS